MDPESVNPGGCDRPPDHVNGGQRQTALDHIQVALAKAKRKVTALEQLYKIAAQTETGSPLEEMLWEFVCNQF